MKTQSEIKFITSLWVLTINTFWVFQGSYAGNAAGFKLNTLPKLLDTRANKPRMTFLHFAVEVAQAHRNDLLSFTNDLSTLQAIAKCVQYVYTVWI